MEGLKGRPTAVDCLDRTPGRTAADLAHTGLAGGGLPDRTVESLDLVRRTELAAPVLHVSHASDLVGHRAFLLRNPVDRPAGRKTLDRSPAARTAAARNLVDCRRSHLDHMDQTSARRLFR